MKIKFIHQDPQGKITGEHVTTFGNEAWAFDDIGGYLVDDMKNLKLGASFTMKKMPDVCEHIAKCNVNIRQSTFKLHCMVDGDCTSMDESGGRYPSEWLRRRKER